ncbi:MAG: hypothetical protein AB7I27_00820 [Bacteriovoracaceae bacterium]
MNLLNILLEKSKKNQLGHFYLLETTKDSSMANDELQKFVHLFIKNYYQQIENHKQSIDNLMDHPDVFVLESKDSEHGYYTVEESEGLARFLEFKAVQSKRKFAVIKDAHRINTIVANKWLKLLEEPTSEVTIFLLNPRRQKLLDTIHSRAIHLRLPIPTPSIDKRILTDFIRSAKEIGLAKFIETNSKNEFDLNFWSNEIIKWEAEQADQPLAKKAIEEWLRELQEMELYHQPTATKWALFYSFLNQHIFPRKLD